MNTTQQPKNEMSDIWQIKYFEALRRQGGIMYSYKQAYYTEIYSFEGLSGITEPGRYVA